MQRGNDAVESALGLASARNRYLRSMTWSHAATLLLALLISLAPVHLLSSSVSTVAQSVRQTSGPAVAPSRAAGIPEQQLRVEGAAKVDFINSADETPVIERTIADYLKLKGMDATWVAAESASSLSFVRINLRGTSGPPDFVITVSAFRFRPFVIFDFNLFTNFKVDRDKALRLLGESNGGVPSTCRWTVDTRSELHCLQSLPLPEAQYSLPVNEIEQMITLNVLAWNRLFPKF